MDDLPVEQKPDNTCPSKMKVNRQGILVSDDKGGWARLINFGSNTLNFIGTVQFGNVTLNEYLKRMIYITLAGLFPEHLKYDKTKHSLEFIGGTWELLNSMNQYVTVDASNGQDRKSVV